METKIQELKKKLEERKMEIIHTLMSDMKIHHPQILLGLIYELRGMHNLLEQIEVEE